MHTVLGAAVVLGDHQILRHVHQTPGQVTRVGGLERGIGQTLTGAVGGDEVLNNVEAFTEIGRDWRFDDRTIRLGHQATHAGQLANLRRAASGTRVGHDVDGVERGLGDGVSVPIDHGLVTELLHHGSGHLIVSVRPDVDYLVVALAVGDQAGDVLLGDLLHFALGAADDAALLVGRNHVVDANRGARPARVMVAGVHELISEHHGRLQAHLAVAVVDQA